MTGTVAQPWALAMAFALLAHLVADFPLQRGEVAERKGTSRRALLEHLAFVFVAFAVLMVPCLGAPAGLAFAAVQAVSHGAIDLWKIRQSAIPRDVPADWEARPAVYFVLDQAAHLAVVAVSIRVLAAASPDWSSGALGVGDALERLSGLPVGMGVVVATVGAILAAVLIANVWLAYFLVDRLVNPLRVPPDPDEPAHGAAIGIAERLVIVGLVLIGRWDGIAAVLGIKALARFPSFSGDDGRRFAEQFILGTMASVGFAVATAALARWVIAGSL